MTPKKIRGIAIVLPQFHEIPENDAWWGKGFTEWTNTKKAVPLFNEHYQPHTPHDAIGYYNLGTIAGVKQQISLAQQYGIYGFCYYHYWFNGRMLLEKPVQLLLKHQEIKQPFMLCWANENWTRVWDGSDKQILMQQHYHEDDDKAHMKFLCEHYFSDSRYIKINGAPVFAIYRHQHFPDIAKTVMAWKEIAKNVGFPDLYLIAVENHFDAPVAPQQIGFNANMMFPPAWKALTQQSKPNFIKRKWLQLTHKKALYNNVVNYETFVHYYKTTLWPAYNFYPGVCPGWDNSARRKDLTKSFILHNSTPEQYKSLLQYTCDAFTPLSLEENFVFINAMNEWAEGNHLEPCKRWGFQYLEATHEILKKYT
jgi:lipopolysaccharide biosynthesis protein